MSLSYEEQKQILIKEFLQIEVSPDQKLTKDELYLKLDQKLGKKFERGIADQLIVKLDTDEDGKIVAEQFYSIVIEAEQSLIQKIEQTRMFLSEYKQKRKDVVNKYELELQTEKKNEFNIMIGSLLYIKPIETSFGENLTFVKVQCGISQETILWNEISSFPIQTSTEDISVAIFKTDGDEPLAITHIQLSVLKDQKKVEKWVNLNSFDGRVQKTGKVKLEMHWIHSKTELLENVILSWDNQIKQLEEDLYGYKNDLTTLLEPFPGVFQIIRQVDSYQENQQFESYNGLNKGNKMKASFLDDPNQFIPSSQQSIQVSEIFKALAYSNLAYMIVALFLSFDRVVYLDILICMSYFVEVYTKSEYNIRNFKLYSIATLVSTAFEIIWLVLFTINWWKVQPGYRVKRAVVIFSFVFAIIKTELVALYLYLYSDYSKNPEKNFAEQNIFDNSPKGSFLVGENMNVYQNKIIKQDAFQIQPSIYFLNTPQCPPQPNMANSKYNSKQVSYNNLNISNQDLNQNDFLNINKFGFTGINSNRPSNQYNPDNSLREQSVKNNQQSTSIGNGNFSTFQNNLNQQYYVNNFNINN